MADSLEPQRTKKKKAKKAPSDGGRPDLPRKGPPAGEWLRLPTDQRSETKFLPVSNLAALIGVSFSALGSVVAGAGFWGLVLRKAGTHPYALPLLLGGIFLFFVGLLVSARAAPTILIGDAGVAIETSKGVERLPWNEVDAVALVGDVLTFRGSGHIVNIPRGPQPHAFARGLLEARARIPGKASALQATVKPPPNSAGEQLVLPAPQLAGLHCKASDRLIAFETDARLCGRCGETYHKLDVPRICLTCGAVLG